MYEVRAGSFDSDVAYKIALSRIEGGTLIEVNKIKLELMLLVLQYISCMKKVHST